MWWCGGPQRLSLWEVLVLTVNKTVARTNDLRADARKLQVCVWVCVCEREKAECKGRREL